MKSKIPLICILLFLCLSCKKTKEKADTNCFSTHDALPKYGWINGSMCNSDTCVNYQTIWKELFIGNNELSNDYFDNHITPRFSSMVNWNSGVSFQNCYVVKIDWAVAHRCDQFIVEIKDGNSYYPNLGVKRGSLLSRDEVKTVVERKAFNSEISKVSSTKILKYGSLQEALNELLKYSKVKTLCLSDITIDETTGNPTLQAYSQYANKINSCISAKMDLVTGKKSYTDSPCLIAGL